LDREALARSPINCRFATTRVQDAKLVLLDPEAHDIYEVFKASLAVPGCWPEAVYLGDAEYLDGGTVNPLPVDFLLESGMNRVVAILSKPLDCESEPPNLLERAILWRYFQRWQWMNETLWEAAEKYNQEVSRLEEMSALTPPSSLIIAPERIPPARFITRDRRKINRTIDMGYQRAEALAGELQGILLPGG
jgi:predicted patatin/cPLA2 family phospholipase